ncbi:MAG: Gfo/Idh/MocA family oxidoreductase [Opitutaceae bacterium]|nr:Gfo/Idh/MocA family oxidoreductase [Opitutaceae bacterium]
MPQPLSRRSFVTRAAGALAVAAFSPAFLRASSEAKKSRLGVALVGLGSYSTYELAPALRETEFCHLTAVVTGSREKGVKWARRHKFPESSIYHYDTMHDLARNPDVDIVYVVTPPGLHRQHVERAAAAGKHVICEKPMAPSVADCDAMIAACKQAGTQLAIGYRLHYDPYHQELVRAAVGTDIGPFTKIDTAHGFTLGGYNWRIDKALAGGGPLPDVGIYSLHAACMAANADPIAITASENPKQRPDFFIEVEESINWTMEFPNGVRASCRTSYNEGMNHFRAEGPNGFFELDPAFYYRGLQGRTSKGSLKFPEVRQQAVHMDAIAKAILANRPVPTPGELGRRDVRIIEAIYEAARTGGRITLG